MRITIGMSLLIVALALFVGCRGATKTGAPPTPTGGHPVSSSLPTSITPPAGASPVAGVTALTAGGYHTCALAAGELLCWGDNEHGQLGDGTTADRALAAGVEGLTGEVVQIAAGFYHTCAIVQGGALDCWGLNSRSALGDGTAESRTGPTAVSGMQSGVAVVAPGRDHTCALQDGRAWCWGNNTFGQVGDGTTEPRRLAPVQVAGLNSNVTAIGAGWYHTCALTEARAVLCWGNDQFGQLGDGAIAVPRVNAPIAVQNLPADVVALAVGGAHNCVLTAKGAVQCWGRNNYGQLGDGTTTDRATPVDVVGLPDDVIAIAAGTGQTCALAGSGGVKCWGHDWYGELGDGTSGEGNDIVRPVDVQGLPAGVTALAMGRFHTCVLADGGGVWCWGRNGYGELGDGTRARRPAPVPVLGLPVNTAR